MGILCSQNSAVQTLSDFDTVRNDEYYPNSPLTDNNINNIINTLKSNSGSTISSSIKSRTLINKPFTREMIHPPPSPIASIATFVSESQSPSPISLLSSTNIKNHNIIFPSSKSHHIISYKNHFNTPSDTLKLILSYWLRTSLSNSSNKSNISLSNISNFIENDFSFLLSKYIYLININQYKFIKNNRKLKYKYDQINLASDDLNKDDNDTFDYIQLSLYNNGNAKISIKSDHYLRLINRSHEEWFAFEKKTGFWYVDAKNEITVSGWLVKDYKNSIDKKTAKPRQFKQSYSRSYLRKVCLKE